MKNKFVIMAMLCTLLNLSLIACNTSQTITVGDKIDIYSAAIRQLYVIDHNYEETFSFPTIYMVATTDDESGGRHITEPTSILLEESIQSGIKANIDDFSADIVWLEEFSDVAWEGGQVEGGGVIIKLGNIQLQEDGSVLVPISITFASLGAEGLTYIVQRIEGIWQVVGDTGVRWMA